MSDPLTAFDSSVEQQILSKGLTAPRVTPRDIEDAIEKEYYCDAAGAFSNNYLLQNHYQALRTLTFCVLVLRNGFTVTGESACASPENFDAELGRKIARQNAVQKLWPLLGFLLKQDLYVKQALSHQGE